MEIRDEPSFLKCMRGDTSPPFGSDSPASMELAYHHAVVINSLCLILSGDWSAAIAPVTDLCML